jgi:hypothetical protein
MTEMVGASGIAWFFGVLLVVVLAVLWLYCLVDVLIRSAHGPGAKAGWAIALVLLAPFAIVAYLVFGRRPATV